MQHDVALYYSPDYARSGYAFDTTRKARWIAHSLDASPLPGIALRIPDPLAEADLVAIHDRAYVAAVRTGVPRALAESQGFLWDSDIWPTVLAANSGAVAAALTALQEDVAGSLSSGLHHARRDRGAGFCTFNGLALAANAARVAGARRILILDLDAHCGGGTQALIRDDPAIWHTDVAVSGFDRYAPAARGTLDVVDDPRAYLPTIAARLRALVAAASTFDLCLYNAGMDPDERCAIGGLRGITAAILAEREHLVFAWCRRHAIPIAFVAAGGYVGDELTRHGLVDLHRLTLQAACAA